STTLRFYRLKISAKSMRLTLRNVGYMARIGFATFVTELAIGVMIVTGNYVFMSRLGENGVAAYSIGCYLFPLIFSLSNAVAQSAQPIISFNYGAGHSGRVAKTLRLSLITGAICGAGVSLIMWLAAPLLAAIFLPSDTTAFTYAVHGLPLFGLSAVLFSLNIVMIGYYQSIEKAGRSTLYTVMRGIIYLIPAFIALPKLIGDDGLWLAIPTAELLTLLTIALTYRR
ncbi:MAG: MATE family efflux transporter, partial [Paramuribaculum sp.]|nr:MATE family efflux transporter [Paramuribaculum sp.]